MGQENRSHVMASLAELVVHGEMASKGSGTVPTRSIFHFQRRGQSGSPTKAALATAFNTNILTPIAAALNASWSSSITAVRWVDDATDPYENATTIHTGGISGDRLPPHNAAFLLCTTLLRGRSYRGSKHLGPVSESDTTAGSEDVFNAACIARWQTVINALVADLVDSNGITWDFAILSRTLSQTTTNPTTIVANVVQEVQLNERIGRMKKRQVKSVY
jgi:hypothetical protein